MGRQQGTACSGEAGPGRRTRTVAVEGTIYTEALLLLGGAVVAAPLFKRIGLGTILGYLAAGVAIGPVGAADHRWPGDPARGRARHRVPAVHHRAGAQAVAAVGAAPADLRARARAGAAHRRRARPRRVHAPRAAGARRYGDRLRPGAVVDRFRAADPGAGGLDQHAFRPDGVLDPALPGPGHRAAAGAYPASCRRAPPASRPRCCPSSASRSAPSSRCSSPGGTSSTRCSASSPTPAPGRR